MEKPSVSLPQSMLDEIEERRPKGSNRSEYIRESVLARFEAEDADEWERPDLESTNEITADD
jgi:Arc/MetJ-type ribon-helix-helix transcriptional regulator